MYDYLIVGAGLYGAVCAEQLTKKGYKAYAIAKLTTKGEIIARTLSITNCHKPKVL